MILFTGRGGAGSWVIRGEQLGKACGGVVQAMASDTQIRAAELVVAVKRVPEPLLQRIRRSDKPWLLDVVDAWSQPRDNALTRAQAIASMQGHIDRLRPDGVIYPTARMMQDVGYRGFVLYHHARPGIGANPIRERVKSVCYEGREAYLGHWRYDIEQACKPRGWSFVVNPPSIADHDIVVALRGDEWTGYAPRSWKSNVKLANAQASRTPAIVGDECGYLETLSGGERTVCRVSQLSDAFDSLASAESREVASERMRPHHYTAQLAARDLVCGARSLRVLA